MKLKVIKIYSASEIEEAMTAYLNDDLGAVGIEVRKRSDFIAAGERKHSELVELDSIDDLPEDLEIIAYFDETVDLNQLIFEITEKLDQLTQLGLEIGNVEIKTSEVKDQDWNLVWQDYYHVVHVTQFLTIVPEWIEYQPKNAQEITIKLDPGLSFGTGTHITTQLALLALEKVQPHGKSVLDIGTGSGILAIAAHKMAAKQVVATDIDEQALTASRTNLALNEISDVKLFESDLLKQVSGKFDIIIANILTEILLLLVPNLADHLTETGQIIMSGIDIDQFKKLEASLDQYGFEITMKMQEERWVGLIIQRKEED